MTTQHTANGSGDLRWFTSSHSGSDGGDCVEVAIARSTGTVHVRDSKDRQGPVLRFTGAEWAAFVGFARQAPDAGR